MCVSQRRIPSPYADVLKNITNNNENNGQIQSFDKKDVFNLIPSKRKEEARERRMDLPFAYVTVLVNSIAGINNSIAGIQLRMGSSDDRDKLYYPQTLYVVRPISKN